MLFEVTLPLSQSTWSSNENSLQRLGEPIYRAMSISNLRFLLRECENFCDILNGVSSVISATHVRLRGRTGPTALSKIREIQLQARDLMNLGTALLTADVNVTGMRLVSSFGQALHSLKLQGLTLLSSLGTIKAFKHFNSASLKTEQTSQWLSGTLDPLAVEKQGELRRKLLKLAVFLIASFTVSENVHTLKIRRPNGGTDMLTSTCVSSTIFAQMLLLFEMYCAYATDIHLMLRSKGVCVNRTRNLLSLPATSHQMNSLETIGTRTDCHTKTLCNSTEELLNQTLTECEEVASITSAMITSTVPMQTPC